MDKNTIYGLILMAAIFFAFMYFTPRDKQPTDGEKPQKELADNSAALGPDMLSETEMEWLRSNIREQGKASADGTSYTVDQQGLSLTIAADTLYGTVNVNGKTYSWADIEKGDAAVIPVTEQRTAIEKVRNISNFMGKYGRFSRFLTGTDSVITLQNDVLTVELSSRSGSPTRAVLKKYYTEYDPDESVKNKHKNVELFNKNSSRINFDIPMARPVNTANLYFTPRVVNDSTVLMLLQLENGAYWGLRYTLPHGDSYVMRIDVVQNNKDGVLQSNNRTLGFHWEQKMARQEKGRYFEEQKSALYYKFAGGNVEDLNANKDDSEDRKAKIRWIGYKNQFFSTVMVGRQPFNTADFESAVLKKSDFLKDMKTEAEVTDYDWHKSTPASFSLFMGPNLYPLLSHLDEEINVGEDLSLTRMIPLGWSIFRWINTGIVIPVFTFLGQFISNYGIIILLLTLLIKTILFPLAYKSLVSQAKMRILAPDIQKINEKYPGKENMMVRQQKTTALYSQAGASPMAGCLPMLLQLPILFAMFSFFPSCIELRGQSFLWVHDLSSPDAIISWSGNIPLVTEYFGNHISLFCLLMTVTNIIYTYLNTQNQSNTMPGMKWMMYLMPVFFMIFFNNYAAALSYFYFLSLLITIIQTYVFRYVVKEEDVRKKMAENAKKPRKKSGFMARLEEAQRQQQALLREQQKRNGRR